jgi:hypothetical protein
MANPQTQQQTTPIIRRKVTYFEDRESSIIQRQELRGYLGMLLGHVRCRVPDSLCDKFKLYVHFKKGSDVQHVVHEGYENVRKELQRLVKFVEKEKSENGTR